MITRRRVVAAICLVMAVIGVGTALAAWHASGTGTGSAGFTTLAQPSTVSAAPGVGQATITVSVGPASPSAPASGYDVKRGGVHVCYITAATGSCTETGLAAGNYTYAIFSLIGTNIGSVNQAVSWTSSIGASATATGVTVPTAPTPGTPALATGSDTGSSSTDKITDLSQPTFTGSISGQAGLTVHIFANGVDVGSVAAGASATTYSVAPTSALADGTYSIVAKSTFDGITFSSASTTLSGVLIDTVAPSPGAVSKASPGITFKGQASRGSGSSTASADVLTVSVTVCAGTSVTSCASPAFTGTGSVNSSNGNWSITSSGLVTGTAYTVVASQSDAAGNTGTGSLNFTA